MISPTANWRAWAWLNIVYMCCYCSISTNVECPIMALEIVNRQFDPGHLKHYWIFTISDLIFSKQTKFQVLFKKKSTSSKNFGWAADPPCPLAPEDLKYNPRYFWLYRIPLFYWHVIEAASVSNNFHFHAHCDILDNFLLRYCDEEHESRTAKKIEVSSAKSLAFEVNPSGKSWKAQRQIWGILQGVRFLGV